jgi:hypothetical protein
MRYFFFGFISSLLIFLSCDKGKRMTELNNPVFGPGPGNVYREYVYGTMLTFYEKEVVFKEAVLKIDDLDKAVRAELSSIHFSGHCNTGPKSFTVNGNDSILLAVPQGTKEHPDTYFAFLAGNNAVPVPLDQVKEGDNTFIFTDGGCIGKCCGWPAYEIHRFVVRIYYDPSKSHPTGKINNLKDNGQLTDHATISASAAPTDGNSRIERVDFIGYYGDYPFDGAGPFKKWHYPYPLGRTKDDRPKMIAWCVYGEPNHIGTATEAPYRATWNNQWVPDQARIAIMARIVDSNGIYYMTEAVGNLTLEHKDTEVKLFAIKPEDLPTQFWAFPSVRGKKIGKVFIDDPLGNAKEAQLVANIAQYGIILLNGQEVHYQQPKMPRNPRTSLPLDKIKQGENTIEVSGKTTKEHLHTCWPGPAVKVAFGRK